MKNLIIGVVAVLFLLCYSLTSYAENWVEFHFHTVENTQTSQTLSAVESFYDSDSLRFLNDGKFKIWIKSLSFHAGVAAKALGKGHESKTLLIINCNQKTFETLSGGLDTSNVLPEFKEYVENANRGSIKGKIVYEKLADIFCAKKSK